MNINERQRSQVSGGSLSLRVLFLAALATPLASAPALADRAAVKRGQAVVDEWCRDCHVREGEKLTADMAPALLGDRQHRRPRPRLVRGFLEADHFPMTTFRLFDHEKADVVEWLLDLQRRQR
jgi:mono/diheme cytochrome c family protein